ncbi:MAG: hypothetical protein KDC98_22795 [Planctomycetes bacterium]|nr:hypothetical protein [Planctomycetota bacterium]
MKRRKKKANPVVAVVFLLGAAALAANSLLGLGGSSESNSAASSEAIVMPDPVDQLGGSSDEGTVVWPDLLAAFGSFDRGTAVRVAFSLLEEAQTAAAAPAGEIATRTILWEGSDPPRARLGVVMVSAHSRRAVLGGQVVGIGGEAMGLVVKAIERDKVVATWGMRTLTYDLEDEWPQEFRAEQQRRAEAAALEASRVSEADGTAGTRAGGESSIIEYTRALKAQERK